MLIRMTGHNCPWTRSAMPAQASRKHRNSPLPTTKRDVAMRVALFTLASFVERLNYFETNLRIAGSDAMKAA